jgi:protein SCO1/2
MTSGVCGRVIRVGRGPWAVGRGPWRCALLCILCCLALLAPAAASAQGGSPDELIGRAGFDQRLDAQVPLELAFRDEAGRAVRLGDYFGDRPVILTLNYYNCPNLCSLVLMGLLASLQDLDFDVGKQFAVVTVSIDPRETPADAAAKKARLLARSPRPGPGDAADGWHFLTGEEAAIEALAAAVGFRYAFDQRLQQYVHASGIVVLTPRGRVARYFYGLEYPARDLHLGLVEASAGRIGTPVDQLLLLCYHYDPVTGRYTGLITTLLRLAALVTALAVVALILLLSRRRPGGSGPGRRAAPGPGGAVDAGRAAGG